MGRSPRGQGKRPAPSTAYPADVADEDLGEFLRRVHDAGAVDPDEPGRWAAFFARLRSLLGSNENEA